MMTIGSVGGAGSGVPAASSGGNLTNDAVGREIQNQIAAQQKKLQDLASDDKLTPEEKMKKRQEIQQEIAALNQQLRQHQIMQRKEQQKAASMEEMTGMNSKTENAKQAGQGAGMSKAGMQAVLSADSSMKQAKVQGSTASRMEGAAGVLRAEIKTDSGRGVSTEKKEQELADLTAKVQTAETAQMNLLKEADQAVREAAKADSETAKDKTDKEKADKTKSKDNEAGKEGVKTSENNDTAGDVKNKTDKSAAEDNRMGKTADSASNAGQTERVTYTPVDIYL